MSLAVVFAHIGIIAFCAFFLQSRVTKFETLISTISVFIPIFGVYVGIVVREASLSPTRSGGKASTAFISLLVVLFFAYLISIVGVLLLYATGTIPNEDLLPAAIGVMEAAFGAYFMSLFLTLFDSQAKKTVKEDGNP